MNKRQFLAKLEKELSGLNKEERERQLDFYEEMINDRIDEGMSEEEAVRNIGTVQGVASKILSEAAPEQLGRKRKIGKKGWICIALAILVLIGAAMVAEEIFDDRFDDDDDELDELFEDRFDLDGEWITGSADAKFAVNEVKAVAVVWSCGNVTVDETEGGSIALKAGDSEALEYQLRDGILYIENVEAYKNSGADLRIFIPEDIYQMQKLSITTSGGNVAINSEYFAELKIVTGSGDISIDGDDILSIDADSNEGNIRVFVDRDDAFVMNYATCSGNVSISYDSGFRNESGADGSGNAAPAKYDHSFGRAGCLSMNLSTDSGNIELIDD